MTTVYISRHSIPFKEHRGIEKYNETDLIKNKIAPLSVTGEKEAEKMSELNELQNIDIVWSSEYVRALSTAKYVAYKNNIPVNIDERFGERIHGDLNESIDMDLYKFRQLKENEYKLNNGESQSDVRKRMLDCIFEIIKSNKNKKIFICSHSTAMTFLFMNWCNLNFDTKELTFNNKIIFDMNWHTPELFKLIFDDNLKLISIENIEL